MTVFSAPSRSPSPRLFAPVALVALVALGLGATVLSACSNDQQPPPNSAMNYQGQGGYPPQQGYPQQQQPYPQQQGYPPQQPYPQQAPPQQQPYPQQQPFPQQPAPAPGGGSAPGAPPPGGGFSIPSSFPFPVPGAPPANGGGGTAPPPGGTSTGQAQRIDPNLAGIATVPLLAFSTQQAPGMQREGGPVAAQFQEGQTLEQPVNLTPNKCYTVLAVGAGVQEVDIVLDVTTPIPGTSPVLAHDTGSGAQASLGGGGNCFKWQIPVAAQGSFVVKATRGQGIIAAQLFSK